MTDFEKEEIIKKVEERVKNELKEKFSPDMFGYARLFEERKKEILKEEYGIEIKKEIEESNSLSID